MSKTRFECPICYKDMAYIEKHIKSHGVENIAQLFVDTRLNGKWPECACGCGKNYHAAEHKLLK